MEALTRRSMQLLRMLYERGNATNIYSLQMKQNDLARKLGISRQALNVHLRKLRDLNYIRTGRGFIDVTEEGLDALGVSSIPAFVFIKVYPRQRDRVYRRISDLAIQRAFRVAGDLDAILIVARKELDETLSKLSSMAGVKDTKSYVALELIR